MALKRWMYRGGHPNGLTKIINRGWAILHSLGIFPNYFVTLEVVGRKSGKTIRFPLAMTVMGGKRFLVSMLGEDTNWVRNVRAAGGIARLRHGMSEQVRLEEVDVRLRAPILKAYLQLAPGAQPHIAISKDAPISEFEKIASQYPVFEVKTITGVEMKVDNARILVIGAGVNGSAIATVLCNAGLDVRILARGKRYEEIQAEGIIIENPFSHKRRITRVPVINCLNPEDLYDFVLVVVRKNQVADLFPVLAQNKSPNIIFMGNNLSGPAEFAEIIDKQRIMLGTVVAGGKRDGHIIRAIVFTSLASIPFGEVDGTITPRLTRLIKTLRSAGIKAITSAEMIDYQMTHTIGVALIGKLVMKYNCDLPALARSKEDLKLLVDARREANQVLRALGHKIIPWSDDAVSIIPGFLQIFGMRWLLNSKFGEVGLAYHVSQAPDEMQQLVNELKTLVEKAGLPVPAIRQILGADGRDAPVP